MEVYVVTNKELGWDCVIGVFTDEEYVYSKFVGDRYVITPKTLDEAQKRLGRKVMIVKFGATWCAPCTKIKSTCDN